MCSCVLCFVCLSVRFASGVFVCVFVVLYVLCVLWFVLVDFGLFGLFCLYCFGLLVRLVCLALF